MRLRCVPAHHHSACALRGMLSSHLSVTPFSSAPSTIIHPSLFPHSLQSAFSYSSSKPTQCTTCTQFVLSQQSCSIQQKQEDCFYLLSTQHVFFLILRKATSTQMATKYSTSNQQPHSLLSILLSLTPLQI